MSARLLIQAGADVDARSNGGVTALMIAAAAGRRVVMNVLLAHGASIDTEAEDISFLVPPGIPPAEAAALHNLLPQAADGATALWLAAYAGHSRLVEELLIAGADATLTASSPDLQRDGDEEKFLTALQVAKRRRHRGTANLIRDYLDTPRPEGTSPTGRH